MMIPPTEHFKHSFEYLRHLATLSAGAIALQIGFVEKLFPHPKFRALVAVSIVAFTGCIWSSIATQWGLLGSIGDQARGKESASTGLWTAVFAVFMWAGFVLGFLASVGFALVNLFWKDL